MNNLTSFLAIKCGNCNAYDFENKVYVVYQIPTNVASLESRGCPLDSNRCINVVWYRALRLMSNNILLGLDHIYKPNKSTMP